MKFTKRTPTKPLRGRGSYGAILAKRNKADADKFAQQMRPILYKLMTTKEVGRGNSPSALARALNALNVPTYEGGKWHPNTVRRLLNRLGPEFQQQVWNHSLKVIQHIPRT